jgi:hypothetical protein
VNGQNLFRLQPGKDPIQNPGFAPTIHSRVDGMPLLPKCLGNPRHLHAFSTTYNNALSSCKLVVLTLPRWRGKQAAMRWNRLSVSSMPDKNASNPENIN